MAWFRKSRPNRGPAAKLPAPKVERLEAREQPAATLLADLNTAAGDAFTSSFPPVVGGPFVGATAAGATFFAADDGANRTAVWRSDGTAAGTRMVAALPYALGVPTVPIPKPTNFVAAGRMVYFTYDDGAHGNELWATDGTRVGTKMVADLNPGMPGSSPWLLSTTGYSVVFASYMAGEMSLYVSDGTAAGTVVLKDLGTQLSPGFTTNGGKLYFVQHETDPATSATTARIWATDGTKAGTKAVATLPEGVEPSVYTSPTWLAAVGSKIYFAAGDTFSGRELWVSDGTAAGTKLVRDINETEIPADPGYPGTPANSDPQQFVVVGKTLYFAADDGKTGRELWRTDGTAAGTKMVADLTPDPETIPNNPYANPFGTGSRITGLRAVGDRLYFSADDGESGPQLYVSDGTTAGTTALTAVEHTPDGSFPGDSFGSETLTSNPYPNWAAMAEAPAIMSAAPGRILFSIGDKTHGRQLWVTDGTRAGTKMVREIGTPGDPDDPFAAAIGPAPIGEYGGKLLFHADDGDTGRQLWATDGTAAGTALVKRINTTTQGSNPQGFVAAGGLAYFTAQSGVYATDGKSAPRLLKQFGGVVSGSESWPAGPWRESPAMLTASGKGAYFVSRAGAVGLSLWRTDGTPAGTLLVKSVDDPAVGDGLWSSMPTGIDNPTDVNGTLFFTIDSPAAGQQLWKSDGTAKGTVLVREINTASSYPQFGPPPPMPEPLVNPIRQVTAVGTRLFFVAGGASGEELWVSDGTAAGTRQVKDINPGPVGSAEDDLTAMNGKVYFTANPGTGGRQLWVSDGTAAGTKQVAKINPNELDYSPGPRNAWLPEERDMVAAGGKLYFPVREVAGGPEQLWASDGTAAGTKRVSNLPGFKTYPWSLPETMIEGLTAAGGKVYFSATDPALGRQLYVSDGTAGGTKMVGPVGNGKQSVPVPGFPLFAANPAVLAVDGGRVYFAANDGKAGRELWVTDGTAAGTKLLQDFNPGPAHGTEEYLMIAPSAAVVNRRLLLGANDGVHGVEPWAVALPEAPTAPPVKPAVVAVMTVTATEGEGFTARLASVNLPPSDNYRVIIRWGDGTSSTGTLTRYTPTGKTYTVFGSHTYAVTGSYTARVVIMSSPETVVLSFDVPAKVADARFYAGRVAQRLPAGTVFSGVVATITDLNLGGQASDFTASVDWGDGRTSRATVRKTAAGRYEVVADTSFATGKRTVTVTITSVVSGKVAKAESIFIIDPPKLGKEG